MSTIGPQSTDRSALASLRRRMRPRALGERCELCGAHLAQSHAHLLEPATRRLQCACEPCALLFDGQGTGKFRRVPRRVQFLADFRLSDAQWLSLNVPIKLAYFFRSTPAGRVIAQYPSPAGAVESQLEDEDWESLIEDNPALATLEADVEALLVNRAGPMPMYFRVPIDVCFELTGLLRLHWRGLSGGTEVWKQIGALFDRLRKRAAVPGDKSHG